MELTTKYLSHRKESDSHNAFHHIQCPRYPHFESHLCTSTSCTTTSHNTASSPSERLATVPPLPTSKIQVLLVFAFVPFSFLFFQFHLLLVISFFLTRCASLFDLLRMCRNRSQKSWIPLRSLQINSAMLGGGEYPWTTG